MKMKFFGGERREASEGSPDERAAGRLDVSGVRVKRIMVAVDFSEASRRALEYAVVLAKGLEGEIVLVHVFEGVPGELKILEASYVDSSFREEARESLSKWEREVSSMGVTVEPVFCEGAAIGREIIDAAKECRADLIVIGRHGSESFFMNNTMRKVLGHVPCPVLVGP